MSWNASVSPHAPRSQQEAQAAAEAAAAAIAIVILTLTVLLGVVGNSLVIWVAGFRLKVGGASTAPSGGGRGGRGRL